MTALPLLYSFRRCPYAIRARLAIASAGVAVAQHEVDLKHKPAALLALSPKGTVPVLHLPSGQVLDQSLDIMRWALTQHDPQGWLHTDHPERDAQLIAANDGPFKHWLDRYKYLVRHPDDTAERCQHAVAQHLLTPLEQALGDTGWLSGRTRPNLTDAALLPFVRQLSGVDTAWFASTPWPRTRAWLARWLAEPLWAQVMQKPNLPATRPQPTHRTPATGHRE
jgi:UPF0176 protein